MGEQEELNKITETIIGAAIEVHRTLGPGLLSRHIENVYATNYSTGICSFAESSMLYKERSTIRCWI